MHADANILERYQSQIIQILKFLVFIVLTRSFFIIFLILNYTILFVRVAVVVNFINKFCSSCPRPIFRALQKLRWHFVLFSE